MALRLNSSGDLTPVSNEEKSARDIAQFTQILSAMKTAFIWFEISHMRQHLIKINAPFEVTWS